MTTQYTGMPSWLLDALQQNSAVQRLDEQRGVLPFSCVMEEALVIAASYLKKKRPILLVKQNVYQAQRVFECLSALLSEEECCFFGCEESLRVEAIAHSLEFTAAKVDTLSSILENPNQVVVTCVSGYMRHLPCIDVFKQGCITLSVGDTISPAELKERLQKGGYSYVSHIDQPLSYAQRGEITDVFSINYEHPVRIEFFDEEIESIRFFDESTQKTLEQIDTVKIIPASDILFSDEEIQTVESKVNSLVEESSSLFLRSEIESQLEALKNNVRESSQYIYYAYLDKTGSLSEYMGYPLTVFCDYTRIEENRNSILKESIAYIQEMAQEEKMLLKFGVWKEWDRLKDYCQVMVEDPLETNISTIQEVHIPNEPLEIKLDIMNTSGKIVFVLNEQESDIVKDVLKQKKIKYHILKDTVTDGFQFYKGSFTNGFEIKNQGLIVYTSNELFEVRHRISRYEKKFRNAEILQSYNDLEPMDYVVHAQYGVGQYLGIETKTIQGIKKDFLKVIYKGNAELLVPLEQFKLVRKFVGREGVVPKLNKLGSGEWEKTKARLEANVNDIAERLLDLYSSRVEHIGHAFSKDTDDTVRFNHNFLYELTRDQQKAIDDITRDMESDKPMDRLVCGDVGFGKTEIAIRASFKAVQDGYQVAVLCPTTILAEQHYATFVQRYENFPVSIRVLDRFQTASEVKSTLKGVKKGTVDILIGTHRVLSKDVQFKQLGLLVVDEEQRFGVEQKEKIKEMKNGIDVLTLSATPIPRTLQMSLVGIRQLSQLDTPPMNRYSVQTYVVEKNTQLIVEAIEKELARNGQVFYLFNNVQYIYNVSRTLQEHLPQARIGVVHGQMDREAIEDTMMLFHKHELDILVCTTIVENGIDVPNANTIFIENAQDFGLSQIYQIKGRVGRSNRIAYAYLLIPPRKQLSEVAAKRLQAVKEFATMGSGYKIAMRDLTIRGAGDMLGSNQSGFINTVGIDMYIEMLEKAIQEKKTGKKAEEKEIRKVNVAVSTYIPKNFSADDYDKLDLYHQIDKIQTQEELENYKKDIIDQYGKLPKAVVTLFDKRLFDILISQPIVKTYRENKKVCEIVFTRDFSDHVDGVKFFEIMTEISKDIHIGYIQGSIVCTLDKQKDILALHNTILMRAKEALKDEN